jgi:hypothetical protein
MRWLFLVSRQELIQSLNNVETLIFNVFGQYCLRFNRQVFVINRQLLNLNYLYKVEGLSAIKDFKQIPFNELIISTQILSILLGKN